MLWFVCDFRRGVFHAGASFSKAQRLFVPPGHVNILFTYLFLLVCILLLSLSFWSIKSTYFNIDPPASLVVSSWYPCDVGHMEDVLEVDKTQSGDFFFFFFFFRFCLYLLPFFFFVFFFLT